MAAELEPTYLHELLGGRTAWTEELWDEAIVWLLDTIGPSEAEHLYEMVWPAKGETRATQALKKFRHVVKDLPAKDVLAWFVAADDLERQEAQALSESGATKAELCLGEFRRWSPTVLLGAFDMLRDGEHFRLGVEDYAAR